jgi:putative transposase
MTGTEHGADLKRLCQLVGVSRAGYYRHFQANAPARADADLRDAIQKLCLKHRHYGYRRITVALARCDIVVNSKRVQRLVREDNLLAQRFRPFAPMTTQSRHGCAVVPNLIRGLKPTGLDQIWVADITYIRLSEAFVYLAVILDAHTRRAVGWALNDHLEATLAIEALDLAIALRKPQPDSLIHHSDRGVQYACADYARRLDDSAIRASMSRTGNPYDNAKAESFMKTLKAQEVNGKTYKNLDDARRSITVFIATIYNADRLHSALEYRTQIEFEQHIARSQFNPKPTLEAASPN